MPALMINVSKHTCPEFESCCHAIIKDYKNTNHQPMHKESFIINHNTLLHVSTLLGHLQWELFVTVTLGLHFTVEWECAVDCVRRCFWRRELSAVRVGPDRGECNPSVTVTKSSHWRWPSRVETCRSVLRPMIKLSLCICWWLVFLYDIVHGHGTH
jgi:hypothetical protein